MTTMMATSVILFSEAPLSRADVEVDDTATEEDGLPDVVTICVGVWRVEELASALVACGVAWRLVGEDVVELVDVDVVESVALDIGRVDVVEEKVVDAAVVEVAVVNEAPS